MRLSHKFLKDLPDSISRSNLKINQQKAGIMHLGLGNFYRAHQCIFTQDAMIAGGGDWAYVAAAMSSTHVVEALKEQDFLYTHIRHDNQESQLQIVDIIKDAIVLKQNPQPFYHYMANPDIRIVTLTITEKGYYFEPSSGKLLQDHPDIIADIQTPNEPKTAIGFLVYALSLRRQKINQGLTILSCDNLPNNGKITKTVLLQYAQNIDEDLADWIDCHVTFPSSMVDRITPKVTQDDISWLNEKYGYEDTILVQTEVFSQWVIEDVFPYGRPLWEKAGAQMVKDVSAYEEMKLRLLNGTHSAIAYLGYLAGYVTVDAVMAESALEKFIRQMMDEEITPSLDMGKEVDLGAYKDALIRRYKNPNLKHSTYQIAMDGSQKIPQRIMGSFVYQYEHGGSYNRLAISLAAWLYYIQGCDEKGMIYEVQDPLAQSFISIKDKSLNDADFIRAILSYENIFGAFFHDKEELIQYIIAHYIKLKTEGVFSYIQSI